MIPYKYHQLTRGKIMTAMQAINRIIMQNTTPYTKLREKLYTLKCRKARTNDCTMKAFYAHCIHDTEKEIFALQEKEVY